MNPQGLLFLTLPKNIIKMGKRLTGTEKWDKEWFMTLTPKLKCLWMYINDRCDQAGMWEVNYRLATMCIGEQITEEDINVFGHRIEKFAPGKIWIVGHVDFQCGMLSERSPAHKPVFRLLKKYSLLDRVSNRLPSSQQEKEREIEREIEIEKEREIESLDEKFKTNWDMAFDEMTISGYEYKYKFLNIPEELSHFMLKCNADPHNYHQRDPGGLRMAFLYQLKDGDRKSNGKQIKQTKQFDLNGV